MLSTVIDVFAWIMLIGFVFQFICLFISMIAASHDRWSLSEVFMRIELILVAITGISFILVCILSSIRYVNGSV